MARAVRIATALLLAAAPLAAQQAAGAAGPRIGLGLTLNATNLLVFDSDELLFLPAGFNNFLVPIQVNQRLTVEPEFGVFHSSASSSGSGSSSSSRSTNLRVGVGLLTSMAERGGLRPYFGPRVGVVRSSSSSHSTFSGGGSSDLTSKQNSWYASGVVGAQYFFSRHFSLGGEAQLTYLHLGQPEETGAGGPSPSVERHQSILGTAGVVMVRCFF